MRITALVKRLDHVCCRYRLAAYRPFFAQAGHHLDLRPWPKGWLSRLSLRHQIGPADVIIVQRKLIGPSQISMLKRAADFLVYDFDDAIFIRDSFSGRGPHSSARAQGFADGALRVSSMRPRRS